MSASQRRRALVASPGMYSGSSASEMLYVPSAGNCRSPCTSASMHWFTADGPSRRLSSCSSHNNLSALTMHNTYSDVFQRYDACCLQAAAGPHALALLCTT